MGNKKYVIKNPRIVWQIKYAESLFYRKFTDVERQVFEWAYTQGREDLREGK